MRSQIFAEPQPRRKPAFRGPCGRSLLAQLFTLDRAFQLFRGGPISIARSHSFVPPCAPTNAKKNRHIVDHQGWTISPAFERARMAFNFASGGPSTLGANAERSSNAETQTGLDLEEISTDVGFSQCLIAYVKVDSGFLGARI